MSKMSHILYGLKLFLAKIQWDTKQSDFGLFHWFAQNTAQMRCRAMFFHISNIFWIKLPCIWSIIVKYNRNTLYITILKGWIPPPSLKKRNWVSTHLKLQNCLHFRSFFIKIRPDYQEKHEKFHRDHLL